ncbi:hypothetical protein HDV00_000218 [Rhizophlyctis rosea]|nr:hypothetical protein HDV00_000218 [Rhizophlyctis rosea]
MSDEAPPPPSTPPIDVPNDAAVDLTGEPHTEDIGPPPEVTATDHPLTDGTSRTSQVFHEPAETPDAESAQPDDAPTPETRPSVSRTASGIADRDSKTREGGAGRKSVASRPVSRVGGAASKPSSREGGRASVPGSRRGTPGSKPPTSKGRQSTSQRGHSSLRAGSGSAATGVGGLIGMEKGRSGEIGGEEGGEVEVGEDGGGEEKGVGGEGVRIVEEEVGEEVLEEEEEDEGWMTPLEDVDEIPRRKTFSDPYITACKILGIVPSSYISQRLKSNEIAMPHHGLGPKGAQALAQVLETNTSVTHIDLTGNHIEFGGAHLGKALHTNTSITHLNLTGNQLGWQGGRDIAEMLSENSTLRVLILRDNKLGDTEASLIGSHLRNNSTLTLLDLSHNNIGCLGAMALGSGVAGNDTLKELNIGWNQIRPKGLMGFLTAVRDNVVLSHLILEANGLGENGQPVATLLAKNTSLQVLNLARTRATDTCIQNMLKAVEQSYSLRELDLSDNPITDQGGIPLFKAVMNNSGLKKFCIKVETRNNDGSPAHIFDLPSISLFFFPNSQNMKLTKEGRGKLEELKAEKPELLIVEADPDPLIAMPAPAPVPGQPPSAPQEGAQ